MKMYIENPKNGLAKRIYTTYSEDTDITFILEDIIDIKIDEVISTEIKGFYYGHENDKLTQEYYGELKANFK